MTAAIEARGLGKQYGRRRALPDCTLTVPAGHVAGPVGPNGAGQATLLNLATGMLAPATGSIQVLGSQPASGPDQTTAPFNASQASEIMIRSAPGSTSNGTMILAGAFCKPGAWILSGQTNTRSGKVFTGPATAACPGNLADIALC